MVEHLSSKFRRKERFQRCGWAFVICSIMNMFLQRFGLLLKGTVCLDSLGERRCSKILMAVATCFLFSMTGVSGGTGVDGRHVNDTSMGVSG